MLRIDDARIPKYRRHKPTGQAVVSLSGKDIYLGPHGSKKSRAAYDRLIGEWLAAGRSLPKSEADLTVAELILRYWRFCKAYYIKNGEPSRHLAVIKQALRHLRQLYGPTPAAEFGPCALRGIQQVLVGKKLSRSYCNSLIGVIKRLFKWGTSRELVPVTVHQALATVGGLAKGRTTAREPIPVRPVPDAFVEATIPHLPAVVADMVRLQRLTGCRPGELCIMRPCDIDTSTDIWRYRPESHKTEHYGHQRMILIGPKGQNLLRPYLLREKSNYCFVPSESERKRNAARRQARQSPMTPSQARRRPKRHRGRPPGDRYDPHTYRRSITRAVDVANRTIRQSAKAAGTEPQQLPRWRPNQLRHSSATQIRAEYGLEAAQVVLGHASADVTQVYAERDLTLAAEVMRRIG